MSQQQSTQAKIATQGGVSAAVGTDVTDATLKASKQQESVESGGKVTDDIAKALSAGVDINAVGSSAIASAGVLAGTMVGGKTASDIAAVGKFDSAEQYAEAQAQKSSAMTTVDKTRLEKSQVQEQTQEKLDNLIGGANDKKLAISQAIRSGAVELDDKGNAEFTKDGRLKASTGSKFTDALSMFGTGDMASTSQLIMGGQRINMDTDMDGNVLQNRDSSENLKRGRTQSVGISGYPESIAGFAGEVTAAMAVGTGMADGVYRKFGPKGNDGIVKPMMKGLVNAAASTVGVEKPFGSKPDEGESKSDNSNNSKPTDGSESKVKNGVQNKTPKNKDEGKTPPDGDSVPKDKESVKSHENGGKATKHQTAMENAEKMMEKQKLPKPKGRFAK